MNTEEINRKYNELAEETTNFYNTLMAKIEANKNEAINKAEQNPKVGDWVKTHIGSKYRIKGYDENGDYDVFGYSKRTDKWETSIKLGTTGKNKILTESEVLDFLKQEAEKRYKEGDEVKSVSMKQNVKYPFNDMTCITKDYFVYNGISVLDLNSGEWSEVMEKQEEKPLDIKETLQKYIKHVDDCEGSNFISRLNTSESDVKFTQEEVNLLEKLSEYPAETKEEKEMATCTITRNGYTNIQLSSEVYNLEEGRYKLVKI